MQILGLLGMYFDAVVVEVKTFLLLFRLALAILCLVTFHIFEQFQTSLDKFRQDLTRQVLLFRCNTVRLDWMRRVKASRRQ